MNSSYNISMNMNVDNIGLQNNFSARSWPNKKAIQSLLYRNN